MKRFAAVLLLMLLAVPTFAQSVSAEAADSDVRISITQVAEFWPLTGGALWITVKPISDQFRNAEKIEVTIGYRGADNKLQVKATSFDCLRDAAGTLPTQVFFSTPGSVRVDYVAARPVSPAHTFEF